eukprot:scaffold110807_cov21-Tisochrysis_lutea.AAC.1
MASAASHSAPHTPLRTLDTLDSEGSDAEDAGGIGADGSSCLCVGSAWASTCITADKTVVASSADVDATDAACGLELLSEAVVVVVVAGAQALAAEVRVRREGARSASSASRTAKCAACKRAVSASPSPSGTAACWGGWHAGPEHARLGRACGGEPAVRIKISKGGYVSG